MPVSLPCLSTLLRPAICLQNLAHDGDAEYQALAQDQRGSLERLFASCPTLSHLKVYPLVLVRFLFSPSSPRRYQPTMVTHLNRIVQVYLLSHHRIWPYI
jgi:hypothetical protein